MQRFGITEAQLRFAAALPERDAGRTMLPNGVVVEEVNEFMKRYRDLIRSEVDRTEDMFDVGDDLLPLLDPSVRGHIALFGKGGRAILQAIRDQDYDTLSARPALSGWQKSRLLLAAVGARL